MARLFIDTSALLKLYHNEPLTPKIQECVAPDDELLLSGITFLEFQSAFFGLVRQGLIGPNHAHQRIALLRQDSTNFQFIGVGQPVISMAEVLMDRFGISEGLRPADALQLASALEAHAQSPVDALLTTDRVLGR